MCISRYRYLTSARHGLAWSDRSVVVDPDRFTFLRQTDDDETHAIAVAGLQLAPFSLTTKKSESYQDLTFLRRTRFNSINISVIRIFPLPHDIINSVFFSSPPPPSVGSMEIYRI